MLSQPAEDALAIGSDIKVSTRAPRVKLDEDKLLDPVHGLAYLRKHHRLVKLVRGSSKHTSRGSKMLRTQVLQTPEFQTLTNVLAFYQVWAHELFPKASFAEFVPMAKRVGKLLARVRETRRAWREFERDGGLADAVGVLVPGGLLLDAPAVDPDWGAGVDDDDILSVSAQPDPVVDAAHDFPDERDLVPHDLDDDMALLREMDF